VANARRTAKNNIKLTLSDAEAETLQTILSRVGGNSETSPRKYADSISAVLPDVTGVRWWDTESSPLLFGSITFDCPPEPSELKIGSKVEINHPVFGKLNGWLCRHFSGEGSVCVQVNGDRCYAVATQSPDGVVIPVRGLKINIL
jgi:hypothetical protein